MSPSPSVGHKDSTDAHGPILGCPMLPDGWMDGCMDGVEGIGATAMELSCSHGEASDVNTICPAMAAANGPIPGTKVRKLVLQVANDSLLFS